MTIRTWTIIFISAFITALSACNLPARKSYEIGDRIDSLNGVYVYYNGPFNNVSGRNVQNGYNVGLRYQCVEFVKRYYLEHYNHKMPNSYGHAKDFFLVGLKDGQRNKGRNLIQYTNGSKSKPKVGDLVVYKGNGFNRFGHVSIVSAVGKNKVEIIQQNVGKRGRTRETYSLKKKGGKWTIGKRSILGWLRKG